MLGIGRGSALSRAALARTIKASVFDATCRDLMDEVAERFIGIIVTKRGTPRHRDERIIAYAASPRGVPVCDARS